jgi:hypothetical protein
MTEEFPPRRPFFSPLEAMPAMPRTCFAGVVGLLLAVRGVSAGEPVDYLRDVKPLLKARCYACHGGLQQRARLRLDTAESIREGGRSGPAVVPGKSGESILLEAVTGNGRRRMPPEDQGKALSAKQIALLREWIDQGAKAPAVEKPEEDPRKHWAFQKPVRPAVPVGGAPGWSKNPIDAFVAAEQAKHGLTPNPPAAKETLLRRVYLDLIGLPPTRDELHAFLADTSENAYEKVVDRLLDSPRYGERWARHWMDVWRYSDWYGRRRVPDVWNSAPQIWRWRDWIIKSLNADRGYDRMLMEMLAADEIAPGDDEAIVATGYLVRNWYALNPNQWMRDIVEHTGKTFLGLTFNCAHCHDHKYDPISNEEYFRFRAFFEPLQLRQDRLPGEADPGPFQKYEYVVLRKVVHLGRIAVFDEKPDAPTFMYRMGDERNRIEGKPPVAPAGPAFLGGDKIRIEPVTLPLTVYYPGLRDFIRHDETTKREQAIAAARAALDKATSETLVLAEARLVAAQADLTAIKARIAADDVRYKKTPGDAVALARAASKAERLATVRAAEEKLVLAQHSLAATQQKKDAAAIKTNEVAVAAAPKVVDAARKALETNSETYTPLSPVYPTQSSGRRRALAQWIASRDNPLTARVAVNHIWMRHFGKPLVASVYDFGRNGKKPTHPELLDWLACELMDGSSSGDDSSRPWSMKHLHRLIVTCNTYRMQSKAGGPNAALDTENRYLWHFNARRAEGEVIRDSVLHAAGQLDPTLGGRVLENDKEATSRRRSLYFAVYPEDGGSLQFVAMFDAPDPCDCYRRTESIVPQQALVLTNSSLLLDASRLLARKLSKQAGDDGAFIAAAFEQVLSRGPTPEERATCLEFLSKQTALLRTAKASDAKGDTTVAPSADPALRAREGLVRALFSHDDFVMMR